MVEDGELVNSMTDEGCFLEEEKEELECQKKSPMTLGRYETVISRVGKIRISPPWR